MALSFGLQSFGSSVFRGLIKRRILKTRNSNVISVLRSRLHLVNENFYTDNLNITDSSHENLEFDKIKILSETLGIPENEALIIFENKRVLRQNGEKLQRLSSFLIEKFNLTDILRNTELLHFANNAIENYVVLREIGFPTCEITPSILLNFEHFMNKSSTELKSMGLIPSTIDPLENLTSVINANEDLIMAIKENLRYLSKDPNILSLKRLRHIVLCSFLAEKLDLTLKGVFILMETYKGLKSRSLSNLSIGILRLEEVGFAKEKVIRYLNLVTQNVEKFEKVLEMKELNGVPIIEIIYRNASLLSANPKNILANEKILKENNISPKQAWQIARIYNLFPHTILERLENINKIPEFRLLKNCPLFLKLILNYNTVQSRLKEMKSQGYYTISLNCLTCSNKLYSKKIVYGSDKSLGNDLIYYLTSVFDSSFEETKKQVFLHPKCKQNCNLVNAEMVINYLLECGISKEQLWNGLAVVLYLHKVVAKTFEKMEDFPELQPFSEWLKHPFFLHLIIYYIEKPSRFCGDGIFNRQ